MAYTAALLLRGRPHWWRGGVVLPTCGISPPPSGTPIGTTMKEGKCNEQNRGMITQPRKTSAKCLPFLDFEKIACYCSKRQCEMEASYVCSELEFNGKKYFNWVVKSVSVSGCQ